MRIEKACTKRTLSNAIDDEIGGVLATLLLLKFNRPGVAHHAYAIAVGRDPLGVIWGHVIRQTLVLRVHMP